MSPDLEFRCEALKLDASNPIVKKAFANKNSNANDRFIFDQGLCLKAQLNISTKGKIKSNRLRFIGEGVEERG